MRIAKAVLALAAALLSAAFARLWLSRRALPYGEEGQYFDAALGVTYSEGAVAVYSAAALLAGLATLLLAVWAWRR
ncbi:hypothetical protein ACFOWX_03195 [Sphingorhabdus arenilitoris]|uniref:Uncharacterized protein n=1 Tax=Sphingorhabdus arenilitoris TaxID=1490041 RepID=A0ABV8RG12_9SPHN